MTFPITQFLSPASCFNLFFASSEEEGFPPVPQTQSLEEWADYLTSDDSTFDQWMACQEKIKAVVNHEDQAIDDLIGFIEDLIDWGMRRNPEQTFAFLVQTLELAVLNDIAQNISEESKAVFQSSFQWAAFHKDLCPEPPSHSLAGLISDEWRKCRPQLLYFVPNLINIFLGAFNFLDSNKKYTSLWEKYLLLEIVYKFFIIPYCIVQLLKPFIKMTGKVYAVAAAIIAAAGVFVFCYQRWLRPMPNELINCTNLEHQLELGYIHPKVGQEKELDKLIQALLSESNVLIVGRSGEGKTALMHHFVQLKNEKQLPEEIQNLTTYELDCGLMMSHVSYGHAELINQTREQIEGFEDQVVLFLDEFYQLANHKEAFRVFQKRFLEDKPSLRFVAAVTLEEFTEIKKLDTDQSFLRRVELLPIESSTDEQCRLILYDFIRRSAGDIPILDEAVEAAIALSENDDILQGVGRPAKAIKILTEAIGMCRAAYSSHSIPQELCEARQDYEALKMQAAHAVKPSSVLLGEILEIKATVAKLEKEDKVQMQQVEEVKAFLEWKTNLEEDYFQLTHLLADAQNEAKEEAVSEELQKLYLLYYFFGIDAIKAIVQEKIDLIKEEKAIQVDQALVELAYENYKKIEENLYGEKKQDADNLDSDDEEEVDEADDE